MTEEQHEPTTAGAMPLGVITYSFASMPLRPFAVAEYVREAGLTRAELKIEHLQLDAGAPGNGKKRWTFDEATKAAYDDWFKGVTLDTYKDVRRRYDALGVDIHIFKLGLDEPVCKEGGTADFWCDVAHALGADEITTELPPPETWAAKGPFYARLCERHGLRIGLHNHTQLKPDSFSGPDSIFQYSDNIGLCFDIGHFVAANGSAASMDFVRRHRDRIFSLHVKDRKELDLDTRAVPFGEGDVPFAELFAFIKKDKWTIPGDIEIEYAIPEGSNAVLEVAKCARRCRRMFEDA